MLILPIKKRWFEMIKSGEKMEEYREFKKYYHTRFKKIFGLDYKDKIAEIIFRSGYSKMSPKIKCRCKLRIGQGKPEWGAEEGKEYYILEILEVGGEDETSDD